MLITGKKGPLDISRSQWEAPAAEMPDQIPEEIKEERLSRLMTLQAHISLERNQKRIGKEEKLLITGKKGPLYIARSQWEAPDADGHILLRSDIALKDGQFVNGRIVEADTYDLTAELIR